MAAWLRAGPDRTKPRAASLAAALGVAAMVLILCSELWPASGGSRTGEGASSGQTAASYRAGLEQQLAGLIAQVEAELGGRLADLPREEKQRAVRLLEERGAFTVRKSVEAVARALGVSRFTVYNYLNRERG